MKTPEANPGSRKRSRWIAVLLALLAHPVFGMLYLGRGRRALVYFVVSVALIPLVPYLGSLGYWPLAGGWAWPLYLIRLIGAVDAFAITGRAGEQFSAPWYSRWYAVVGVLAFFLLATFSLRAFVIEPFRIPSGSMMPTLLIGDHIVVNKHAYGVRLPLSSRKILDVGDPQRGDVMVFRYPDDPSLSYVMRVIGREGDRVIYRDKQLRIDGQTVVTHPQGNFDYLQSDGVLVAAKRFEERIGHRSHSILIAPDMPVLILSGVRNFPHNANCSYDEQGFSCSVPPGHFFVMGDNRDNAADSRYWGFVPEANIIGKVVFVWWSSQSPQQIGPMR